MVDGPHLRGSNYHPDTPPQRGSHHQPSSINHQPGQCSKNSHPKSQLFPKRWKSWGGIFDVAGKNARAAALRNESSQPGFWDDAEAAQKSMQELARLEATVTPWQSIRKRLDDAAVML